LSHFSVISENGSILIGRATMLLRCCNGVSVILLLLHYIKYQIIINMLYKILRRSYFSWLQHVETTFKALCRLRAKREFACDGNGGFNM